MTKSRGIYNKWTTESFCAKVEEVTPGRWNFDKTVYVNFQTDMIVTCPKHGDVVARPQTLLKGVNSCKQCNGQRPIRLPELIERCNDIFGPDALDFSQAEDYRGINSRITVTCRKHNQTYSQIVRSLLKGKVACPYCSPAGKRQPLDLLVQRGRNAWPNKNYDYTRLDPKLGMRQKQEIGCPVEGHGFFLQTLDGHLHGREGCPACDRLQRQMDVETFIKRSQGVFGPTRYDYTHVTLTDHGVGDVTLVCPKHGEFTYKVFAHLQGLEGCEKCRKVFGPSKGERELADWVESLGVKVVRGDRKTLGGKEIDILIPDFNLGIEYNGLYYHSDRFLQSNSHRDKHRLARAAGVQLLQIWEDDWHNKPDVVKDRIRHLLGLNNLDKVAARSCNVRETNAYHARTFLEEHHIQGFVPSTVYLGLFDDSDEVVAVATFLKSGRNFILTRYATSRTVVGGFTKLVKHFEKGHDYDKLVTFADHMISDGGLYEKNGWIKELELAPDYFYVFGGQRHHKFAYRKTRFENDPTLLWDANLTETQLAEINGLWRVWDAGKTRYSLSHH